MSRRGSARGRVTAVAAVVVLGLLSACGGGGGSGDFTRQDDDEVKADDKTDDSDESDGSDESDESDRSDDSDESDQSDEPTTTRESTTTSPPPTSPPVDEVIPVLGVIDDIIIRDTIADLNQWWTSIFPSVYPGASYSPPTAGAWSLRPGETVECGSVTVFYEDVANNAIYAPCDDQNDGVFFDVEQLLPGLAASAGQFAPAFVAAHEWGHLVQYRGGEDNSVDVTQELQADCFAGAWVAHVIEDGTPFEIVASDIDVALAALLEVADPVGFSSAEAGAHGSGFDRVSAFGAGLADVANCIPFQTDPPPIFEMEFTTQEDADSGGNLKILEIADLARRDLETFFLNEIDANYPLPGAYQEGTCDGARVVLEYCPSTGQIVFDAELWNAFHDFIGDFATGTLLARAYAATIDATPQTSNCIVGAWTRSLILHETDDPPIYNLRLSPGDLDEAVRVFLIESQNGEGIVSVTSMRRGILEGLDACVDIAQNG